MGISWLPSLVLTVVIGAPGAGKSTVGALLAQQSGRAFYDADDHAGPSYARAGWSVQRLRQRAEEVGFEAAHLQWEPALLAAVLDLAPAHPHAVLALGAGHSHLRSPELFAQLAAALHSAPQVVLLRPAVDTGTCLEVLRERCLVTKGHDWQVEGVDWLARWLSDGRDEQLATDIVHTASETPELTAQRIDALPVRRTA